MVVVVAVLGMLFGHPEKITGLGDDECSSPLVPKGPGSGRRIEGNADAEGASSAAAAAVAPGGNSEERAIFWSFKQGVYFAYKWRCVSFLCQSFMGKLFFQKELHERGFYYVFLHFFREWKIMACRACIKVMLMFFVILMYAAMWNICDLCIMYTMVAACGVTLLGGGFMFSSCWIGILATFLKGFRIGSTTAHVDVKWNI